MTKAWSQHTLSEVWKDIAFRHEEGAQFRLESRAADGSRMVGTTAFFRYRKEQRQLAAHVTEKAKQGVSASILSLPSSIGAEALSLAILMDAGGAFGPGARAPVIDALDIHEPYLGVLKANIYPAAMRDGIPESLHDTYTRCAKGAMSIRPDVHARVNVLPAQDFRTFGRDGREVYDFVSCCNLLRHLDGKLADNVAAITALAGTATIFSRDSKFSAAQMNRAINAAGLIPVDPEQVQGNPKLAKQLKDRGLGWISSNAHHVALKP